MIVKYGQQYEQQVVDLWNKTCTFDSIDVNKFRRQALFDENFDEELCYVAIKDEKVVGFILGIKRKFPYLERGLEPNRGWISVMFVAKEYRNRGIGQALLDVVENKLFEMGATDITLGAYSPNYFFAGIDPDNYPEAIEFFEKNNYKAGEKAFSMGMNLHGYQIREKTLEKKKAAEEKGYRFINFDYKYALELLEYMRQEFGGGWKRNALIAMQKNKAQDRILLVLDPQGKICGCSNRAIDDNEMRFGPIGISASERNSGLGTILMELGLYEMAKKGIYRMYFVTTDENGRRYYERMGLEVIRTFVDYRKDLSKCVR